MFSKRISVPITERQDEALEREAERLGVTVPEVVRRMLDAWIDAALVRELEMLDVRTPKWEEFIAEGIARLEPKK